MWCGCLGSGTTEGKRSKVKCDQHAAVLRSNFIAESLVTSYTPRGLHLSTAVHPGTPAQCSSAQTLAPGWRSERPRSPGQRHHHQTALESRQTLGHSELALGL